MSIHKNSIIHVITKYSKTKIVQKKNKKKVGKNLLRPFCPIQTNQKISQTNQQIVQRLRKKFKTENEKKITHSRFHSVRIYGCLCTCKFGGKKKKKKSAKYMYKPRERERERERERVN